MNTPRKKIASADELMATAAIANVLADAAECSFRDPDAAIAILRDRLPANLPDFGIECLRVAVTEMIVRHCIARDAKGTEFEVHRHFWANLERYLPGATRIKSRSNQQHMPDGWVEIEGVAIPVEIKRDEFNVAAARQLARYMTEYGIPRGIAVAREIRCPRDPRVIYVEYEPTAL